MPSLLAAANAHAIQRLAFTPLMHDRMVREAAQM
jgi:hypothetical protein